MKTTKKTRNTKAKLKMSSSPKRTTKKKLRMIRTST